MRTPWFFSVKIEQQLNDRGEYAFGVVFVSGEGHGAFVVTLPDPCLADTDGDGLCTPTDFTAWIANFNDGFYRRWALRNSACTARNPFSVMAVWHRNSNERKSDEQ